MARNYNELRSRMSPERRARNEQRAKELLATMPLDKLREARSMTQIALAQKLKVGQGSVSKLEGRTDTYLSTLREYIEALGGKLVLRAEFPDGTVNIQLAKEEAHSTR